MSLFKRFENNAKNSLGRIQERSNHVDTGRFRNNHVENQQNQYNDMFMDDFSDPMFNNQYPDEFQMNTGQKPESFHFFILENQYRDIELLIRGFKEVYNKETKEWVIRRKEKHCFNDEEAEDILRTAQSYLSTDIKLAIINRDEYPILLRMVYDQLDTLFTEIAEYRYGRYGAKEEQFKMKQQNLNIFNVLTQRIKSNYSRAIDGRENKATHEGVRGQESLQQTDRKRMDRYSYT